MTEKLPLDHYDEINVHFIGEAFAEDPKHGDVTDAGLFEIEEVNHDVTDAIRDGMEWGDPSDLRGALREAEQMRRLIEAAPEMYRTLKWLAEVLEDGNGTQRRTAQAILEDLPDLDVDLDEVYPWLGERDAKPSKEDPR